MSFFKKTENFTCEHCGQDITGDGYTNHCSSCLWSKHVDNNPGDRENQCGGLMRPVDLYLKGQKWIVVHRCEKCGEKKTNKVSEKDDFEEVIRIEKEINEKKIKG